MPELPEVEYVRRNLQRWLKGGRIHACTVHDPRIVRPRTPNAFADAVVGRRVSAVERKGKWLRLTLNDGQRVFGHLAMTGWFERAPDDGMLRFERVRFGIERAGKKPSQVVYVDSRRWGHLLVAKDDIAPWASAGPDPFLEPVDAGVLRAKLARRTASSIKEALLDQKLLAGIGNIQAAEALWKAKIDPRSPAAAMTTKDVQAILRGIGWTLERTLRDLEERPDTKEGPWVVYGRKGEPCRRCKTTLVQLELGGRTTTYCPGCQRLTPPAPPRATSARK